MSITISDLSYHYPNRNNLFSHISLTVEKQQKAAIVGSNGTGKSTLLKLLAGQLQPSGGSVAATSQPYYIPQHTGLLSKTVAETLGVNHKLAALDAIAKGSINQHDYDTLADDWEVEARCQAALNHWLLPHVALDMQMDSLSGGEKTKVFLAGLLIHSPEIVLLDEPTNHLDQTSRAMLYQHIQQSTACIIIVSHDVTLLNQLDTTYELSEHGMKLYGGNYTFYQEQKELTMNALNDSIHNEEKTLRLARKKAQEVKQRQEKRITEGAKNKSQVARIIINTLRDSAENTAARLKDKHSELISDSQSKLAELRQQRGKMAELKIDFDNASLHPGKLLVEALQVNIAYHDADMLWKTPIDMKLYSSDRVRLTGDNGAGKTTLIKLLTGVLAPSCGQVVRSGFRWIYLDQDYAQTDVDCTVEQLAESFNAQKLQEHELKIRLNRFLFSADTWDKNCRALSGGEKLRLYLCCLMISNQTPDLIILDEPTNNLDIASLQILVQTIKDYRGSLLVISHDSYFVNEIGISTTVHLER